MAFWRHTIILSSMKCIQGLLRFLINDQCDAKIPFYVFIFIYNSLHVWSTSCSSSGETNCINTASCNCHSVSVTVSCAHDTATNTEWQLPEAVLIKFVSPDDEHDMLETRRELKINKNKCVERNFCVTLVIYQESLHDARSTKCKKDYYFHILKCFYILRIMSVTLHYLFSYLYTVGFFNLCRPKFNLAHKVLVYF